MRTVSSNNAGFRRRCSKNGMTMIEIVIAVMVLGLVVASTFMAMRAGFTMIQLARDNTMAGQILQSEMENLRLKSWDQLNELEEEEEFQVDTLLDENIGDRFIRTRRIRGIRGGRMKEVEIEVQWTSLRGARHRRVYRTLFGKEGLNDYYYRAF